MQAQSPSSWAAVAFGLILALCLYVGAYVALCEPKSDIHFFVGSSPYPSPPISVVPAYKLGGAASAYIFWPLQKLDQRLFPSRWTVTWVPIPSLSSLKIPGADTATGSGQLILAPTPSPTP